MQTELISYLGKHYGVTDEKVKATLLTCKTTSERMQLMAKHMVEVTDPFFTDVKFAEFVCETLWNKFLMADR